MLADLPGKTIILGVLDLWTTRSRRRRGRRAHPPRAAARARRAHHLAPDCGLKYLPREVAFGKMKAMVAGAAQVRATLPLTGQ